MRLGTASVAFLIGVAGFSTMVASHRLEHIRSVDTVQLIATECASASPSCLRPGTAKQAEAAPDT